MADGHVTFTVKGLGEFVLRGGKITEAPSEDLRESMQFNVETTSPLRDEWFDPDTDFQLAKRLQKLYGASMTVTEPIPPVHDSPNLW